VASVTRAAVALARAGGNLHEAAETVKDDRAAASLLTARTATAPAAMTSPTQFGRTTIAYLAAILEKPSAAAAIIERATRLQFGDNAAVWCPAIAADATNVAFLGEGSPIRVRQFDVSAGVTLAPQKLAFACVLSNELLAYSNAETVVRARMQADLRRGIDALMLDATAGSTTRPPGLLNGVTAESPVSTDTTVKGMADDLSLITSKVANVAALADTIIVASPRQAVKIWAELPLLKIPVYATATLADKVVVAIACSGIAICGSPDAPRIDMNTESVVVMDDSAPAQLGVVGSPNVVAAPARSLFQSDTSCLRLIADLTWQPRAASGVISWVQNVAW
jgi:hypothetical protein